MSEKKGVHVQGIEVTQAIQYYRSDMHLSDPLDRAPDNAARLVADKAAWVRVYVRSGSPESINNVTGSLRVWRDSPESLLAELKPQPPGTVTAFLEPEPGGAGMPFFTPHTFYRWERSHLAATLNFVIPSNLMCGHLRLHARVSAPDGQTHEMLTLLNVTLHQQIRFRAIMIGYKGKDKTGTKQLTVNPPTLADLQTTSALTLLMNPVSATAVYQSAGTLTLTTPLGPACEEGWDKLKTSLEQAADADENKPGYIYYGLIARDVPGQGGGCNWGILAASFEGQDQVDLVMAHEIGHAFQPHAPCGDPTNVDPNYPMYEPYDAASIGEYGLNISTGEVMSPETYTDIMSYCKPNQWISPYGHKLRLNAPLLNPQVVCWKPEIYHDPKLLFYLPDPTFPFVPAKPRSVISILGVLDLTGTLTIENVFRAVSFARPRGVATSLIAVLDGADGQPLASAPMFRISGTPMGTSGCGCCSDDGLPPFLVKALLPNIAPGTALRVLKDGEELWRRSAPSRPPSVTELSAEIIENKYLAVRWRAEGPQPDQLQYWVRWSRDRGETWNGLGTGILDTQARFSLEGLPAGEVELQVVVHDGFFSVPSEPVAVAVPRQPPIVTILHPKEGATIPAGSTLRLWAIVTSDGQEFESDDFRWLVNGREVGRGLEMWTIAPDAGEHRCVLRLEGDRERIKRTVLFKTVATPGPYRVPWSL